jgi:BRCA1-associated protein
MDDTKHESKISHDRALFKPRVDPHTCQALQQTFVQYGNPAVEIIHGCLYLTAPFEPREKEQDGTSSLADTVSLASSLDSRSIEPNENAEIKTEAPVKIRKHSRKSVKHEDDDIESAPTQLCIYDIPAGMTIAELYDFLASFERCILHAQVVAPVDDPDFYIMPLQLRSQVDAQAFKEEFHMQPYNNMEQDLCKIAPLSSAEFHVGKTTNSFPIHKGGEMCAVCLEPVELGATITTLCNHVFHFACLSKWVDSTCPVCRYIMQPNANSFCHVCGLRSPQSALWLCLVCGHVGCGRYDNGHAKEHFEAFNHAFSLDVATQRVWDYSSDQYVHRIAQNVKDGNVKDGKLVTLGRKDQMEEVDDGIKLEQLLVEYNYLLSSELEKQRSFFVAQMNFKQSELMALKEPEVQKDQELTRVLVQYQRRVQSLEKALVAGEKVQLVELARRKEVGKTKDEKLRKLNTRLLGQQSKTRESFEDLQHSRQHEQEQELRALDQQQRLLEEELGDLKFYFKTQKQIGSSPLRDELASATVIVLGGTPQDKRGGRRKHAGKH